MKTLQQQSSNIREHALIIQEGIEAKKARIAELQAEVERDERQVDLLEDAAATLDKAHEELSKVTPITAAKTPKKKKAAKKATKKVAKKTNSEVQQKPRTKSDGVPTLVQRFAAVMGDKATKVDTIIERLAEREGWTPKSKNLKSYIAHQLSLSDEFVNVGRGVYQVASAAGKVTAKKGKKAAEKTEKKAAKKALAKTESAPKDETPKSGEKRNLSKVIGEQRRAVAEGKIPRLLDRLIIVMGSDNLKVSEVIERLKEREGWVPNAKDLNTYISFQLGSTEELFRRTKRGYYEVIQPQTEEELAAAKEEKKPVGATKTNGRPNKVKADSKEQKDEPTSDEVETELEDFGADGNFSANPFA